ncbi:MAG: ABC transporter permease, partial [Actinobacteria bacterium]|nr:ABC transporter permease [Actinomycetota bacterium]
MSLGGISQPLDFLGALGRSIIQLVVVAAVIAWVFAHPEGTVLYLIVMVTAATATSVRRIECGWRRSGLVAVPLVGGTMVALLPVLASGALPLEAQSIVPFTAQVIGGAMTAVSLTGSYARSRVHQEWPVVEGYLALGARPRQAVREITRSSSAHSLIPGLDQTRSAGLVVLPGAFVGMLLGGATPAQAAQVQLLVLAALLAAAATASAAASWTLAGWLGATKPVIDGT